MRLLRHHVHPAIVILAGIEFFLSLMAVYAAALILVWRPLSEIEEILGPIAPRAFAFAIAVSIGLSAMGLYQTRQRLTFEAVLVRFAISLVLAAVGLAAIYFLYSPLAQGRDWWATSFVIAGLAIPVARFFFSRLVDDARFRRRVLVYGAGRQASSLLRLRRRTDQQGFQIVAFVSTSGDRNVIDDPRVLTVARPLLEHAQELGVNEIVVAVDDRRRNYPIKELLDCKFAGINIVEILTFLERESGRVSIDLLNPSWMIYSEGFTRQSYRSTITRLIDLASSLPLLVFVLPIMLVAAIAILVEDGWPILYRQTRVGMMGKKFKLNKLRSMQKDAEADGEARWAGLDDVRITRVGRVIRKTRVDELPQLFNVVVGDMSLVGPRPERPEFVETLATRIPYYHERHCVKPGLTGWAQLSYPYGATEQDALNKLQYDLYYVKNRSLILDLMILLQTIEIVVLQKGAR